MSDTVPVVIDNGTSWTRAGLATNTEPSIKIRTVTGRHPNENDIFSQYQPTSLCIRSDAIYTGDELTTHSGHLMRTFPISRGAIIDWSHMEQIWRYIYKKLGRHASDQPVIITEPPLNPKYNREKIAEIFFEKFQVPSFHITLDTPLALHGVGKTSGLIANIGEGVTSVAAVYEDYTSTRSVLRQDYAGRDVTSYLGQLLAEKGHYFLSTSSGMEILKSIKEKTAYVAEDPLAEDDKLLDPVSFHLPDGTPLSVGSERFLCSEALFQPQLTGLERSSIQSLIFDSIQQSEVDCRRELYRNVFVTGGTAKLPGFDTRVRLELEKLIPDGAKLGVYSPSNTQTAVWCGAANLAAMTSFSTQWISLQEYQEHGVGVVHQKCWSCT